MDNQLIRRLALDISTKRYIIALTGAGISTESGIPDFRGPNGLWKKYDPTYATYSFFIKNPKEFWDIQIQMERDGFSFIEAKPNTAHMALVDMERLGYLKGIITQNIDGLHTKAGNTNVIEFHGNNTQAVCINCHRLYDVRYVKRSIESGGIPPRCECGGILKPNTVLFEEPIPRKALILAEEMTKVSDLMLVIGTSTTVYPAANLPRIAKSHGATIVEINSEPTALTGVISDYLIQGSVGDILPEVVREVRKIKKN